MQRFIKASLFLILFTTFVWPLFVNAAYLSAKRVSPKALPPDSMALTVFIDTQRESFNAISGSVVYNETLGTPVAVTDSGSIITHWIKHPELDKNNHSINFAGAVANGYTGTQGILFTLVFPFYGGVPLEDAVRFEGLRVALNDGLGTSAKEASASYRLDPAAPYADNWSGEQLALQNIRADKTPPESFTPMVSRDADVFGGKWFVSFNTVDKQSGLVRYEVQETRSGKLREDAWKPATSPYLLEDQSLQSYIYVVAIDAQGNERIMKVFPQYPESWLQRNSAIFYVIAIVLLLIWIARKVFKSPKVNIYAQNVP